MQRQDPVVAFATQSGGTTMDRDLLGGNPFASALIELASQPGLTLEKLQPKLRLLTKRLRGNHQHSEWVGTPAVRNWTFDMAPGSGRERRLALVLVVSDYAFAGIPNLAGAAHDERRVSAMLATHGFSVLQGIGPKRAKLVAALAAFRARSKAAEVAVVYATGHGIEMDGQVHLLPADYPFTSGYSRKLLSAHAIAVNRIVGAARAESLNMVFFAGCRTVVKQADTGAHSLAPSKA